MSILKLFFSTLKVQLEFIPAAMWWKTLTSEEQLTIGENFFASAKNAGRNLSLLSAPFLSFCMIFLFLTEKTKRIFLLTFLIFSLGFTFIYLPFVVSGFIIDIIKILLFIVIFCFWKNIVLMDKFELSIFDPFSAYALLSIFNNLPQERQNVILFSFIEKINLCKKSE